MIARQPVEQGAKPRPLAATYVEYEHCIGKYVGFVVDGGKVVRAIETPCRLKAGEEAAARAERLNRQRRRCAS